MTADLESTSEVPEGKAVVASGEKLWSLRRRRLLVSAPADSTEATSKAGRSLPLGQSLRQARADGNSMIDRSSKPLIERTLHLLQRFDTADASNSRRSEMVGMFQRANFLLETAHKVSSLREAQQGMDLDASTAVREVLLVTQCRLEALLLRLCEAVPAEQSSSLDFSMPDEDRQREDLFTSDPWDGCEDLATEDLFEYFAHSLEVRANPKSIIAKTAVGDLLNVCWQQEEKLKTEMHEKVPLVERRVSQPLTVLVDLDVACDGSVGCTLSSSRYCELAPPDNSDSKFDKRSTGTASTISHLSTASGSSIGTASTQSSQVSRTPSHSLLAPWCHALVPTESSRGISTGPIASTSRSGVELPGRGVNKLKHVIEIASPRAPLAS
mmetsp:Transcript_49087/g.76639  ORF Transcript_49087/g.76639 Transcript_49087/m.76639 type:complete len:383 (-) Transcript_49087:75-1223(-)